MSANNSILETSAFYQTALESMIEEFNQETTPGFKLFTKYASHSSSAVRDAAAPKTNQNGAALANGRSPVSDMDNDKNVSNNINAVPESSTPRRLIGVARKHDLFSEDLLMALASKPPAAELSPTSKERKKALERAENERLLRKKAEDSKKAKRTTLRV